MLPLLCGRVADAHVRRHPQRLRCRRVVMMCLSLLHCFKTPCAVENYPARAERLQLFTFCCCAGAQLMHMVDDIHNCYDVDRFSSAAGTRRRRRHVGAGGHQNKKLVDEMMGIFMRSTSSPTAAAAVPPAAISSSSSTTSSSSSAVPARSSI